VKDQSGDRHGKLDLRFFTRTGQREPETLRESGAWGSGVKSGGFSTTDAGKGRKVYLGGIYDKNAQVLKGGGKNRKPRHAKQIQNTFRAGKIW